MAEKLLQTEAVHSLLNQNKTINYSLWNSYPGKKTKLICSLLAGALLVALACTVFVIYGSFPGLYNSFTGKLPSGFSDGSGKVVKVINNSKNPDSIRTDDDLTKKISCLALVDIDHETTAIPADRTWLTDIACDVKEGEILNFAYRTDKAQTFTEELQSDAIMYATYQSNIFPKDRLSAKQKSFHKNILFLTVAIIIILLGIAYRLIKEISARANLKKYTPITLHLRRLNEEDFRLVNELASQEFTKYVNRTLAMKYLKNGTDGSMRQCSFAGKSYVSFCYAVTKVELKKIGGKDTGDVTDNPEDSILFYGPWIEEGKEPAPSIEIIFYDNKASDYLIVNNN